MDTDELIKENVYLKAELESLKHPIKTPRVRQFRDLQADLDTLRLAADYFQTITAGRLTPSVDTGMMAGSQVFILKGFSDDQRVEVRATFEASLRYLNNLAKARGVRHFKKMMRIVLLSIQAAPNLKPVSRDIF